MDLIFKHSESEPHGGYGAGSGTIDTTVYFCPCGKGEVIRIKDNIPGFRDTDWQLHCVECNKKYHFDGSDLVPNEQ